MPRGRFSVACVLRLFVYGVAMITVHQAGDPAAATARLGSSVPASAGLFTESLLLVLLLGMVLELFVGARRWR